MNKVLREQLELQALIRELKGHKPDPVGIEAGDFESQRGTITRIRILFNQAYAQLSGLSTSFDPVLIETNQIMNVGDKFTVVALALHRRFPNMSLHLEGHAQLGNGLGVRVPARNFWFLFGNNRKEWEVVKEAVNLMMLANMAYIAKLAYCLLVEGRHIQNTQLPAGYIRGIATITECFNFEEMVRWLRGQSPERLMQLARLFY